MALQALRAAVGDQDFFASLHAWTTGPSQGQRLSARLPRHSQTSLRSERHQWFTRNRVYPSHCNSTTSNNDIQRGQLSNAIRIRDEEGLGRQRLSRYVTPRLPVVVCRFGSMKSSRPTVVGRAGGAGSMPGCVGGAGMAFKAAADHGTGGRSPRPVARSWLTDPPGTTTPCRRRAGRPPGWPGTRVAAVGPAGPTVEPRPPTIIPSPEKRKVGGLTRPPCPPILRRVDEAVTSGNAGCVVDSANRSRTSHRKNRFRDST
jgi:hypothetical protein